MPLLTENRYHFLHTDVNRIDDESMRSLFTEIVGLRGEPLQGYVIHFLVRSLHPYTTMEKRRPFDKSEFLLQNYLPGKVGDLMKTEIYKLCIDLVRLAKLKSAEDMDGMKLYVLLNRTVPRVEKRKKDRGRY